MEYNKLIPIFAILLNVSISGCKNTITQPDLEGNLVGYVFTFDEFGGLLNNHEKVMVTATGSGRYSTYTDQNGRFELKGIPAGTYELDFDKSGFGSMKQFGIQHLGGGATILGSKEMVNYGSGSAIFLFRMPATQILNLRIENDSIYADLSFSQTPPEKISILCYFSNIPDFDKTDAQFSDQYTLENKNGVFAGYIEYDILKRFVRPPFQPGNTVFFKAAMYCTVQYCFFEGISFYGINNYYDIENNKTIFPNEGMVSAQFSMAVSE
jgi:hypothetical protein